MTVFQSTFTQRGYSAIPGQLFDTGSKKYVSGKAARGLVKAGYGVFKVPGVGGRQTDILDPGEVFQIPNPGVAADVDAIITAITASTLIQVFSGTALNGVVGATEMQPARFVTLVLASDADWDATTATLVGVNHLGQTVTESLSIPDGGNATVTSTNRYRSVTSFTLPAQTAAASATLGISALPALTLADFRGVAMRQIVKVTPNDAALFGYPGLTSNLVSADYIDAEMVPVLSQGGICVYTEEAVSDMDDVYVRIAAGAGGSTLGAFRNDADSASCVQVTGAKFVLGCAAGAAPVQFNLAG